MNKTMKALISAVLPLAPTIATVLGGPLAGTAVAVLAKNLLGKDKAKPSELLSAVASGSLEILTKTKTAEIEIKETLTQLDVDIYALEVEDRGSARSRYKEMKDLTTPILAWVIIVAFFATCTVILLGWNKTDSMLTGTIIGFVASKAEQVVSYFFGSSTGSKQKTALMGE